MSKAAVINFPLIVKQKSCFPCHYSYKAQPLYKAAIRTQTPHLKENEAKQPQKRQSHQELQNCTVRHTGSPILSYMHLKRLNKTLLLQYSFFKEYPKNHKVIPKM